MRAMCAACLLCGAGSRLLSAWEQVARQGEAGSDTERALRPAQVIFSKELLSSHVVHGDERRCPFRGGAVANRVALHSDEKDDGRFRMPGSLAAAKAVDVAVARVFDLQ